MIVPSDEHKEAMVEILRGSNDTELLKGFLTTHGAMFLEENDCLQIYGMLLEVLYDIKPKDIKNTVERVLDQQKEDMEEDEDDLKASLAGAYAVRCASVYRGIFQ